MTTRRKWLLGSVVCMLVVLGVAGYTLETRYEMEEISFPWQKTRRRVIAARRMFDPHKSLPGGGGFVKFLLDKDDEDREALGRKNRATCDKLGAAWTEYFVRCSEAKDSDRARIRAEMQDLVKHRLPEKVLVCSEAQAETEGPPDAEWNACVAFFASGTCEILDYDWMELAVSTHDMMVKKPTKPQPHMEACPLLFGL